MRVVRSGSCSDKNERTGERRDNDKRRDGEECDSVCFGPQPDGARSNPPFSLQYMRDNKRGRKEASVSD